jgi:hypothetical protein
MGQPAMLRAALPVWHREHLTTVLVPTTLEAIPRRTSNTGVSPVGSARVAGRATASS